MITEANAKFSQLWKDYSREKLTTRSTQLVWLDTEASDKVRQTLCSLLISVFFVSSKSARFTERPMAYGNTRDMKRTRARSNKRKGLFIRSKTSLVKEIDKEETSLFLVGALYLRTLFLT